MGGTKNRALIPTIASCFVGAFLLALLGLLSSASQATAADCPNEAFRTGPSAELPDCRAYELVTPPDTNGRLVGAINTFGAPLAAGGFPTELTSPSGLSVVYMTYVSPLFDFGEPNGVADVYQAERTAGGWATVRKISPPGPEATMAVPGGVASDHSYATANVGNSTSSMALGGETDYLANPDGSYELIGQGSLGTEPFAQTRWITPGGAHIIFSTGRNENQSVWCSRAESKCKVQQLEPTAAPTGTGAIYDRAADGPTHVVSLLPGDATPAAGEEAFYKGNSKDATAVAFTIGGTLYVRVDNTETLQVVSGSPVYAGLSDEGQYVFYVSGGNIHRFDTTDKSDDQINSSGDAEVVNVSADGSHVYFVSKTQIGGEGVAGEPNLYVWSGGATAYIATVLANDLAAGLTAWTKSVVQSSGAVERAPGASPTRTTPDGRVMIFESRARLTAYDNGGHTVIYRYDHGDGSLVCISCNPLAEPATTDARLQYGPQTSGKTVIHNLSEDGSRVFFETRESLVSGDSGPTEGPYKWHHNDIYQWHQAEGGAAEIDLITSGNSVDHGADGPDHYQPKPNVLLSVTPDGENVVFLSLDALVPGAGLGGVSAIYNARVNGGFPAPQPPPPCLEEACRPGSGISPPPLFSFAPSEATAGAGNVKPGKRKPHCRRAKHRKHRHCKKKRGQKRAAAHSSSATAPAPSGPSSPTPAAPAGDAAAEATTSAAAASFEGEYGVETVTASASTSAAGKVVDVTTGFSLKQEIVEESGKPELKAKTEELSTMLPPGLLGNPTLLPTCSTGSFMNGGNCPIDSQVGVAKIRTRQIGGKLGAKVPIFNLEPPHPEREVARLGIFAGQWPVFVDISVRTADDYGITATIHSANGLDSLLSGEATIWGNPEDPLHDPQRFTVFEAMNGCDGTACMQPEGKRDSGLPPTVFLTNPSACQPMNVGFAAKSYQLPGQVFTAIAPMPPTSDCVGLPFEPTFVAEPTNRTAGAPTGLKTTLTLPQQSTEAVDKPATATMREARVTLPAGMQINAAAADGIGVCSEEQVGYKQEVNAACPDASKLGTATIVSPSLAQPLGGEIFQRAPAPGRQFGLWLVSDDMGLHVKIPGEIEPDPSTGRLTAVFRDLPQVPTEQITLNVWGGARAPLQNPETCGAHVTSYTFAPHSQDPAVSGQSQMTIDQGCDKGFSPKLRAGTTEPVAGKFSPFVLDLERADGEQNIAGLELTLPDGLLAKIKGVGLCPDGAAAAGSCPADSRLGSVVAAAGAGPHPFWIPEPGKRPTGVYLAGPYQGSAFSIVTVVPAQAGPFDLGNVVVRSGLHVDRESARAVVKANPLPQFFEGVGLTYRRLHVVIDRPGFTLNPTDCREMAITSRISSTQGALATPSARFQVDGCKRLKFKPKFALKLRGGTKRGEYPALSATVKARKGHANIGKVSVALPASEFLAQEHIVTICTRKRFAVDDCPKGSVYGKAKAWTPLLAKPLSGPVYLRSSDNPLPDLVMSLEGEIDVLLVGRIDTVNRGIRTNFDSVPDAPISKFVLHMRGGKKSLLVNSTDICRGAHRATIRTRAQNGRKLDARPLLRSAGCRRR